MNTSTTVRIRKVKTVTNFTMRLVLKGTAVTGFVAVIVVAPNALQAIDAFVDTYDKRKKRKKRFNEQLKASGYFEITEVSKNKYEIKATKKGRSAANNVLFADYAIPVSKEWDKRWHLLMFDVAENDRTFRDLMRRKIQELGLYQIQKSVYVYPYSMNEFTTMLAAAYPQQAKNLITLTATDISTQADVARHFRKLNLI